MTRYRLLIAVGCLILYGSLYPFNFGPTAPGGLQRFLTNWELYTSRGDLLDNILLFLPWGLFGMLAFGARRHAMVALAQTATIGLALSIGAQVLQLWLPTRTAAIADIVANAAGIALGALIGRWITPRPGSDAHAWQSASLPAALLAGFMMSEWLPLVPSLDLQLVKDQVKALLDNLPLSMGEVFARMAFGLLTGYLLACVAGLRWSLVLAPMVVLAVSAGKLFLYGAQMDRSSVLGLFIGCGVWWLMATQRPARRDALTLLCICALYTLGALLPLVFRAEPAPVSWVPFAAMLKGSMITNLRSLLSSLVLFTGVLLILSRYSPRVVAASVVLAAWVAAIELLQMLIVGRTSDITQPLLALIAGQLMAAWMDRRPIAAQVPAGPQRAPASAHGPSPTGPLPRWQLPVWTLAIAGGLALVMHQVLRIPGIPYNLRELFRADGSVWALLAFAAALVWIGAGAVWLARAVARSPVPALWLPPTALLVSLVSLLFLWSGVTTESIEDISGSANVFWYVTNKDTWGPAWRDFFLWMQAPGVIGFLEHCVRYSALYAPLPLMLALMVAVRERAHWPVGPASRALPALVSLLLVMWLCKAIAFDWTSTDNLNELIARDGPWGWGGGGYLYGLVALLCLDGLIVGEVLRARHPGWALASLPMLAVSFPLGWWLLNQGLEQRVDKYGQVFSGTQFLLGPDRTHALSQQMLFLRWAVLQGGAMLVLGVGLWLGHQAWSRDAAPPARSPA